VLLIGAGTVTVLALTHAKLIKLWRRSNSKVKLTYFDLKGKGEPIRYVLSIVGVPFEDYRFKSRDEFMAAKPSLKFGQVPCLTVNDVEYFQTPAICRFVAAYFGSSLYPTSTSVRAAVDAFVDQVNDMDIGKLVASYKTRFGFPESVLNDGNAELVFDTWKAECLPRHLSFFDTALASSPTMWVAGTAEPTIADVYLATQLNSYRTKWPTLPVYSPKLQALVDGVYALPAVVAFNEVEAKAK